MSMVLSNRRLICGISPKIAREICKMCHGCLRSAEEIASALSVPEITVESWLVSLAEADYLRADAEDGRLLWFCSPRGYTALATARFGKPLSGSEFVDLLSAIAHRAKEYNESDMFPLYIDRVYVFGAAITQPWQVEDPNIAIATSERPAFCKNPGWRSEYWVERDPDRHISIVEQLFFAEEELARFLKRPKERCSIYRQDISELSDEKRLLFRGDHVAPSEEDGAFMTASEMQSLGEEIEKHRNAHPKRRRRRKAWGQNEEIVEYWKKTTWFLDLDIPVEQAARCCWRCGSDQDVQRCHIVPDALGGGSEESNLVLLCARCHAEGPNLQDERIMLDWIKSYREKCRNDFWLSAAMEEYERIYGKDVRDEVEEILCREQIQMGADEAMSELRLLVNEASTRATFHFGQTWLNNASIAGCFRLALEALSDHLRELNDREALAR